MSDTRDGTRDESDGRAPDDERDLYVPPYPPLTRPTDEGAGPAGATWW
jgi:hypothetical protein